jgi:hypothetical protein
MQGFKMHGRVVVITTCALALAMTAGATALAGKGLKTKSETESIDPGDNGSATATCKQGTKAVSGGFEAEFDGDFTPFLLISESRREGGRKWTSAAYSPSGGDLTSFAYCRDQQLKTKSATTEVDPSEVGSVTARCKQGEKAFSGGFAGEEVDLGGGSSPVFIPTQSLKQGKREWTVTAYNAGTGEGDLTAYVHCRAGKGVKTKQAEETLGSGEFDSVEARCSRKQRLVSGGFDTNSDFTTAGAYLMGSQKLGKRGWEVAAEDVGGGPTIVAYAYCEKKKKKKG